MQSIVEQEAKKDGTLLQVTDEICAEVSEFKGKIYVGIRKWFIGNDGEWHRTKNGLNIPLLEFTKLEQNFGDISEFVKGELIKMKKKADEKVDGEQY